MTTVLDGRSCLDCQTTTDDGHSRCSRCRERRQRREQERRLGKAAEPRARPLDGDPEPAQQLRHHLAYLRARGMPFDRAWRAAMRVALGGLPGREREAWVAAFNGTAGVWEAAFSRTGDPIPAPLPPEPDVGERSRAIVIA